MKKSLSTLWLYLVMFSLLVGGVGWQQKQQGQKPPENPRRGGGRIARNSTDQQGLKKQVKNFRTPYSRRTIPNSFFVNRTVLDSLLAQPNCNGVRLYLAIEKAPSPPTRDTVHLVVVGVDRATNNDQLDPDKTAPIVSSFLMGSTFDRCPSNCNYQSSIK